jgi:hypothetical protein
MGESIKEIKYIIVHVETRNLLNKGIDAQPYLT